jgi:hypothetical protein
VPWDTWADQPYVHPNYMETSIACIIGGVLSIVVCARAIFLHRMLLNGSARRATKLAYDAEVAKATEQHIAHLQAARLETADVDDINLATESSAVIITAPHFSTENATRGETAQEGFSGNFAANDSHVGGTVAHASFERSDTAAEKLARARHSVITSWDPSRNSLMVTCILLRLLTAIFDLVFGLIAIFGHMYRCCEATTPAAAGLVNRCAFGDEGFDTSTCMAANVTCELYALIPTECTASALLDQYLFGASVTVSILFLVTTVASQTPPVWVGHFVPQTIGSGLTVGLYLSMMYHERHFTPFARGMPWCWLPSADNRDYPGAETSLTVLSWVMAYALLAILVAVGIICLAFLWYKYRDRTNGDDLFTRRNSRAAILRRLLPQIIYFAVEFVLGCVCRMTPGFDKQAAAGHTGGDAVNVSLLIIVVFAFFQPFGAAFMAFVWAFGERFHWALLMPCRYSFTNFPINPNDVSFSATIGENVQLQSHRGQQHGASPWPSERFITSDLAGYGTAADAPPPAIQKQQPVREENDALSAGLGVADSAASAAQLPLLLASRDASATLTGTARTTAPTSSRTVPASYNSARGNYSLLNGSTGTRPEGVYRRSAESIDPYENRAPPRPYSSSPSSSTGNKPKLEPRAQEFPRRK